MNNIKLQNLETQDINIKKQQRSVDSQLQINIKLEQIKKLVEKIKHDHKEQKKNLFPILQHQRSQILPNIQQKKIIKRSSNTRYQHFTTQQNQHKTKYENFKQNQNISQNLKPIIKNMKRATTLSISDKKSEQSTKELKKIQFNLLNFKDQQKNTNIKKKMTQSKRKFEIAQYTYVKHMKLFQDLYDSLASLLLDIKKIKQIIFQKIHNYIQLVRQPKYFFILEFIQSIDSKYHRQLILARVFQYFSITALIIECINNNNKQNEGHLINFIGHSTSNLIFLSKLFMIKLKKSEWNTSNYEFSINDFLKQSFNQSFQNCQDILLKMQLNNEVMNILMNKFNLKSTIYGKFKDLIKNLSTNIPNIQSSFYLMFEYLAYYLHQNNLTQIFPFVDIPLSPFLNDYSQKKYTTIIQPYGVLIFVKKQKLRIRLNTTSFLDKISRFSNIVLWTSLMPQQIDNLLPYLQQYNIKFQRILYRYHANIENEQPFKNLYNIGRNLQNMIILDTNSNIYSKTPRNGIQINWTGSKNDSKLLNLQKLLTQIFLNNLSIEQGIQKYSQQIRKYMRRQKQSRHIKTTVL